MPGDAATRPFIVLFAPKFEAFGLDVVKALAEAGGPDRIVALCTGEAALAKRVERALGANAVEVHHLPSLEAQWLKLTASEIESALSQIEEHLPAGTAGATLSADRGIGLGFIFDGETRPSLLGDAAGADPVGAPRAYLAGLYSFLAGLFDRVDPAGAFLYAVAGAPAFGLFTVANSRGLPVSQISPTRIGSRFMVDDTLDQRFGPAHRRMQEGGAPLEAALPQARAEIEAFRARPTMPEYQQRFTEALAARRPVSEGVRHLRKGSLHWVKSALSGNAERRLRARRQLFKGRRALAAARVSPRLFHPLTALKERFIFFPLHVSPEASTMVLAPYHSNQIAVVEALARAMPADFVLAVKEHLPMMGLRPPGYYERIAAIPRVVLLDPAQPGVETIQHATLTAVITGTAAWESLLLGRPPLVIGTAAYLPLGTGAVHAPCLADLPSAIRSALACPPMPDSMLERWVASLIAESFEMKASVLWDEYDRTPAEERARVSSAIARGILNTLV